jgi:putative heme-binding domain-containing protein
LLSLAETKSPAAQLLESKWDKVIGTAPAPTPDEQTQVQARITAVTALLPKASATAGRPLFEGTCMACHVIGGKGVSLGPPLDGSSKRDIEGLLTSILATDAAVEQVFRLYRIETKTGQRIEGFKKSESTKDITVLLMGGVPQVIPVADIKSAGYVAGKSVMLPLAGGFSDQQIADIAAYLRTIQ